MVMDLQPDHVVHPDEVDFNEDEDDGTDDDDPQRVYFWGCLETGDRMVHIKPGSVHIEPGSVYIEP